MAVEDPLFASFIQAGFECSTHRYGNRRLDLLAETGHDRFAADDFRRLAALGIRTVRTGARWHLIEQSPGRYDFNSLEVFLRAARAEGVELLLDLLHFGWPDFLDVFDVDFPNRFGKYVLALAKYVRSHGYACKSYTAINEISFLSWAAGDVACFYPHQVDQGRRLKGNLVRAAIVASEILLNEIPGVRLISPEPVIHIVGDISVPGDVADAEFHRLAQFEAWDMLSGRVSPELGGREEYLDILGLNFYDRNQWVHHREVLPRSDPRYRPFRQIVREVWERYRRPLFVSETGTEGEGRAEWFRYICREVQSARERNLPVAGICVYPILNHPGWEDGRHCYNGLFDYVHDDGSREIFAPLAEAIQQEQEKPRISGAETIVFHPDRSDLSLSSAVEFCPPTSATPHDPVCS